MEVVHWPHQAHSLHLLLLRKMNRRFMAHLFHRPEDKYDVLPESAPVVMIKTRWTDERGLDVFPNWEGSSKISTQVPATSRSLWTGLCSSELQPSLICAIHFLSHIRLLLGHISGGVVSCLTRSSPISHPSRPSGIFLKAQDRELLAGNGKLETTVEILPCMPA